MDQNQKLHSREESEQSTTMDPTQESPSSDESVTQPSRSPTNTDTVMDCTGAAEETAGCCYICMEVTQDDSKMKTFNEQTWETLKNAAALRMNMKSDKYSNATQRIITNSDSNFRYHSSCHRSYTAVKRAKSVSDVPPKKCITETRQSSSIPKSDDQGLLKGFCFFCGKKRKKRQGKEDPLLKANTNTGCDNLFERAKYTTNERVKSLVRTGLDLKAKEAEYHKLCRNDFNHETDKYLKQPSKQAHGSAYFHKKAFESLSPYIETEVIGNGRSVLASTLLDMYKVEFVSNGGEEADITSYQSQSLIRKVKDKFDKQIDVILADQRRGNFICSSGQTEEDARAQLHDDAERHVENDKLR